jgi:hypothetical protein
MADLALKFGKKAAFHDPRTLKFELYVTPELPAPADSYSSLDRISKNLGITDPIPLFPIDGNDVKGDCTIAGAAHLVTNWRGLIGQNYVPPASVVIAKYDELTGGADEGLVLLNVLKYWKKYGLFGDTIGGFVSVNYHDPVHIKQAISLFGGVYTGFIVQKNAVVDFENGKTWEAGPPDLDEDGNKQGHCVDGIDYKPGLYKLATWGGFQWASQGWVGAMVDEMYVTIPPEMMDEKFVPGFDVALLKQDIYSIAA